MAKGSKGSGKKGGGGRSASSGAGAGRLALGVAGGVLGKSASAAARRPGGTLLVLLVLAIVGGWVFGRGWLLERAAAERGGAIDIRVVVPADVDVSELASLGVDPRGLLRQVAAGRVTSDPFDRVSLSEAAAALERTGWFPRGVAVRREPGGVVRVEGPWRTPTVVVVWGGERFVVGPGGAPMRLAAGAEPSGLFVLVESPMVGPAQREVPGVGRRIAWGEAWPGGDVQEAIELLRFLSEEGRGDTLARIEAVDLSNYEATASGELRLRTDRGGVIVWGAPVGASAGGEVSAERKAENLRAVLEDARGVDGPGSVVRVNLRTVVVDETIGGGGDG